jgi:hypothetical protein
MRGMLGLLVVGFMVAGCGEKAGPTLGIWDKAFGPKVLQVSPDTYWTAFVREKDSPTLLNLVGTNYWSIRGDYVFKYFDKPPVGVDPDSMKIVKSVTSRWWPRVPDLCSGAYPGLECTLIHFQVEVLARDACQVRQIWSAALASPKAVPFMKKIFERGEDLGQERIDLVEGCRQYGMVVPMSWGKTMNGLIGYPMIAYLGPDMTKLEIFEDRNRNGLPDNEDQWRHDIDLFPTRWRHNPDGEYYEPGWGKNGLGIERETVSGVWESYEEAIPRNR